MLSDVYFVISAGDIVVIAVCRMVCLFYPATTLSPVYFVISGRGIVVIAVYRPAFAQIHSSCAERGELYTQPLFRLECAWVMKICLTGAHVLFCSFALARLEMRSNR